MNDRSRLDPELVRRVAELETALVLSDDLVATLVRHGLDNAWKDGPVVLDGHYEMDDHPASHGAVTVHLIVLDRAGKQVQMHVTFEVSPPEGRVKRPEPLLTAALVVQLARDAGIDLARSFAERLA